MNGEASLNDSKDVTEWLRHLLFFASVLLMSFHALQLAQINVGCDARTHNAHHAYYYTMAWLNMNCIVPHSITSRDKLHQ